MRILIFTIILLHAAVCMAQTGKDSLSKAVGSPLHNNQLNKEKQSPPPVNRNKILQESGLNYNAADMGYLADFQKTSLKEVIAGGIKTEQEAAQENAQSILTDIQRNMQDKRPAWQKVVVNALGVAQAAVAVGMAVREVVKKKD